MIDVRYTTARLAAIQTGSNADSQAIMSARQAGQLECTIKCEAKCIRWMTIGYRPQVLKAQLCNVIWSVKSRPTFTEGFTYVLRHIDLK